MGRFDTRHHAYALCTAEEYDMVKAQAAREQLSLSDYVRRCINGAILEQGDDTVPLLRERRTPDARA